MECHMLIAHGARDKTAEEAHTPLMDDPEIAKEITYATYMVCCHGTTARQPVYGPAGVRRHRWRSASRADAGPRDLRQWRYRAGGGAGIRGSCIALSPDARIRHQTCPARRVYSRRACHRYRREGPAHAGYP